ncbi:hypothetical protein BDB00DRAFT_758666 [Zychaea mexicana]|uniref:uncharacterized protein n=1 Tax=Zychaea mexicana TaxID=64656 RepID=UPI0022FE83AE|nr:uncharacterized protein BDB00DRAFT_758666 [Zychaea mexicana]KAI9496339.1 hypothetical protein BDB00DRAFT_758666 [Zychaea mexicana]
MDELASLSLTHVQFDPRDKIAYWLAYITLSPLAILVFYASVIVSRREVAGILMLAGQLCNEGLNAVLKEYLQIARPHAHLGTGYGMPSSHAQFVCIYLGYHSLPQVMAGSFAGLAFGVVWYALTELGLRKSGCIQWALDQPVAKRLYLRDMRAIDNVARWEYQQWEQQVRHRQGSENKQE